MGDGADMALDAIEDDEEERLNYLIGKMTYQEAYEKGIIDELGHLINLAPVGVMRTRKLL